MFREHPNQPAAIITIDRAGRITDYETHAVSPLGWPEAEVLNTSVADLIDPGMACSEFMDWLSAASTTTPANTTAGMTCTSLLTCDGCLVDAIVHLEPSRLYADTLFLFVYVPEVVAQVFPHARTRAATAVLH